MRRWIPHGGRWAGGTDGDPGEAVGGAAANATAHAEGAGHAGNATDGTATTRALLSAADKTRSVETNDELDSEIAKQLREFLENGGYALPLVRAVCVRVSVRAPS